MSQEKRSCKGCGYEVTYTVINDGYGLGTVKQFIALMQSGRLAGSLAVTDHCPKCGSLFSLTSTARMED